MDIVLGVGMPGNVKGEGDGGEGRAPDPMSMAKARKRLDDALVHIHKNEVKAAETALMETISMMERAGAGPEDIVKPYIQLSKVYVSGGDISKSETMALKAVELVSRQRVSVGVKAEAMAALGLALTWKGELAKAGDTLEKALNMFETAKDDRGIAIVCRYIGNSLIMKNLYAKALAYYSRAMKIDQAMGLEDEVDRVMSNMALAKGLQGLYSDAIKDFETLLERATKHGENRTIAICLTNIGDFYTMLERWDDALMNYDRSIALCTELGASGVNAHNITGKAGALLGKGDVTAAEQLVSKHYEEILAGRSDDSIAHLHKTMGRIAMERGDLKKGDEEYRKAERLFMKGDILELARLYSFWAMARMRNGDRKGAAIFFNKAGKVFNDLKLPLLHNELENIKRKNGF